MTIISKKMLLGAMIVASFVACSKKQITIENTEDDSPIQFVLTSDAHYGITRTSFRGQSNVDAKIVNAALVAKINELPNFNLPSDGGVGAGNKIGYVDYVLEAGDIANRMETSASVQLASVSWSQFQTDYINNLTVKNKKGEKASLYMVPGNHDVSNTIGYYAKMNPLSDASSMAQIYNLMLKPTTMRTATSFNYNTDRINYSRDIGGVRFCFLQMYPDSAVRVWLREDLKTAGNKPVIIVAHDQPSVVSNHFKNPNDDHSINSVDKFDNVLDEYFKDGKTTTAAATLEQRGFASFLKQYPNVKAYLHGHVHESKFYTWKGPDNDVSLSTVSTDSPMKGLVSGAEEKKLTFHFCSLDVKTMKLTVRECYWNADPTNPKAAVQWGDKFDISLK